jgi:AcrR family transcriptional regulator
MANVARAVKRGYRSQVRDAGALRTRARILEAGRHLFARKGIDGTTIAHIAQRAGVSEATVYATVKSKAGLLHALFHDAIFGPRFEQARRRLDGVTDPVERLALSAHVARAVYEGESAELGLLAKASAFSPELRRIQQRFEHMRREMQRERIDALFKARRARKGLARDAAADILWTLTCREVYHNLVHEAGWTPDAFQDWLAQTLVEALTDAAPRARAAKPG